MTSPAGVTANRDSAGSQAGPARSSSISGASGGIWPGGRPQANAAAVTARMGRRRVRSRAGSARGHDGPPSTLDATDFRSGQ
jgi:sugar/nucleoside kinase (ribokinase family)